MKIGAHMIKLKRTRAGIFTNKQMVSKEEFEKATEEYFNGNEKNLRKIIIPAEIVSEIYPAVKIKKEFVDKILHGAPIDFRFLKEKMNFEKEKIISVFSDDKFIGMFKVVNEKNIFAKPEFVLQPIKG